ncbi:NAD(P)H-quinone oxidoreductase subunit 5 [Albidovulum inexpectatum]|uniref:Probable inorganic carbon transporter subunit DabB n=1 Tax=Albidovulum inexpectatum TaxID=196587 RepID=A0A2S5JHE5_9RHOB|nr:proton-conducting transporter membrane subunit [Albidovulum inexpectatum]PPB80934.1 NAD(P)H-quinone oxidoreductase subunit 5 [Albidovulum inexpectatum]
MTFSIPLPALAPLILLATSGMAALRPGCRPRPIPPLSEAAAFAALALGLGGVVQLIVAGPISGTLVRLDAVSATMALLVGFVGWIVMRYSRRYLDGESREGLFHSRMLATLAAVLVLVQAAHLAVLVAAFVAVGLGPRALLLFYPDRPEARRAAAKFSLVWHAGDLALIVAAVAFWRASGSADLTAAAMPGWALQIAAIGLVVAALLKTAAFPLHGWLTEVMEAPTPVSALLHAGIINSGGYLLIRMADAVQSSAGAMAALVLIGGFTALFGAVVMLTQSAIKTALAWSTVAQMGFMLMQCGLGLWALALLHILAHSLYKAYAFLGSGGAVRAVLATRRPGPVAVPDLAAVGRSFLLALGLYAAMAALFTLIAGPKSPQALALGAMLVFGVAYLVAQGLAGAAPAALTRRTVTASVAAAFGYFGFQVAAQALWGPHLPPTPQVGALEWALIVLAVGSFGLVAFAQALFPLWAHHPASAGWRVHLANGLYLNTLFDRLIGGLRTAR